MAFSSARVVRAQPVSALQKQKLIDAVGSNPQLISGKFSQAFTRKHAENQWNDIGAELNTVVGGARKEGKQWKKCWQDLKKNVIKQRAKVRKHAGGTGGGSPHKVKSDDVNDTLSAVVTTTIISGNPQIVKPTVRSFIQNETGEPSSTQLIAVGDVGAGEDKENRPPVPIYNTEHQYCRGANPKPPTPKKMPTKIARLRRSQDLSEELIKMVRDSGSESLALQREQLAILNNSKRNKMALLEESLAMERKKVLLLEESLAVWQQIAAHMQKKM